MRCHYSLSEDTEARAVSEEARIQPQAAGSRLYVYNPKTIRAAYTLIIQVAHPLNELKCVVPFCWNHLGRRVSDSWRDRSVRRLDVIS